MLLTTIQKNGAWQMDKYIVFRAKNKNHFYTADIKAGRIFKENTFVPIGDIVYLDFENSNQIDDLIESLQAMKKVWK